MGHHWSTENQVLLALQESNLDRAIQNLRQIETLRDPPLTRDIFNQWKDRWPISFKPPAELPVTMKEIVDEDELDLIKERMKAAIRQYYKAKKLEKVGSSSS